MITLLALIVVPWLAVSFLAAGLLIFRGIRRDRAKRRVIDRRERVRECEFWERAS